MKKKFLTWLVLPGAVFLTGCVSTPNFVPSGAQEALIPQAWRGPSALHAEPRPLAEWWETWNNPELTALIREASSKNTDIRSAQANLKYALAQLAIADASFFPFLDGSSSAGRTHKLRTGTNAYTIGLNGSWTLDAGGIRAAAEAARADYFSEVASLADVRVAIAAKVATAYVNLKLSQKLLDVAKQNLVTQKEALNIADWRFKSGLVDSTDVDQARTSYEQTLASIPVHEYNIEQYRNVLAQLTNRTPSEVVVSSEIFIPQAPENIAADIPGEVLRNRPSVKAAEADVVAALARHTEARAALYPSLTITGSFGLSGATVGGLGNPGTHLSSILGTLTLPIFHAGALRAEVEAKDAKLKAANAAYEASLLTAVAEVEDALNEIWAYQRRSSSLNTALGSARNAAANARQNYKAGLQDFTVVLTTQQSLLTVEESLANAQAQIALAYISLYEALGGGWKPEVENV